MEETEELTLRKDRVATRPGGSGFALQRRRIYQRHLLALLLVGGGILAADYYVLVPGLQFGHFLLTPWVLIFLVHTFGLLSRGYTVGELLIPPRQPPVREVYDTPLDYELVRSRQLRDGVTSAAAAIRDQHGESADRAAAAADAMVQAVESLVGAIRSAYRSDDRAQKVVPELHSALQALDALHAEMIRVEVEEGEPDGAPIAEVEERAEAVRGLIP